MILKMRLCLLVLLALASTVLSTNGTLEISDSPQSTSPISVPEPSDFTKSKPEPTFSIPEPEGASFVFKSCPQPPEDYCLPECLNDTTCPNNKKCCGNFFPGCGRSCRDPEYISNKTKEGQCPLYSTRPEEAAPCGALCHSDLDCYGNQKCCSDSCGPNCKDAVRSGICPVSMGGACLGIPQLECNMDFDCQNPIQLCCNTDCGKRCLDPAVVSDNEKEGLCPVETQVTQICKEFCINDMNCTGIQKCCSNGCGRVCQDPLGSRPGICPSSTTQVCTTPPTDQCHSDPDCTKDLDTKCCNDDGCALSCQQPRSLLPPPPEPSPSPPAAPVNLSLVCDARDCPGGMRAMSVLCADGTCSGPFCERPSVDQRCQWMTHMCLAADPPKPGMCPMVDPYTWPSCLRDCISDSNNCSDDQKCCGNGCGCTCMDPVPSCVVSGFRGQVCADEETQESDPVSPNIKLDTCYRCVDRAICSRINKDSSCSWSSHYADCLAICNNSATQTSMCTARTPCDCLSITGCGWCQVSSDLSSTLPSTFNWGLCLPTYLDNKCTGSSTTGGYSGMFIPTKPTICPLPKSPQGGVPSTLGGGFSYINPNVGDTSGLVLDVSVGNGIKRINDGSLEETVVQDQLEQFLPPTWKVVINKILQATTDGQFAIINTVIDVFDSPVLTDSDLNTLCTMLNEAYALTLGFPTTLLINCQLLLVDDSQGLKLSQSNQNQYIHTTDLVVPLGPSPVPPPSSSLPYLWVNGVIFPVIIIIAIVAGLYICKKKKNVDRYTLVYK